MQVELFWDLLNTLGKEFETLHGRAESLSRREEQGKMVFVSEEDVQQERSVQVQASAVLRTPPSFGDNSLIRVAPTSGKKKLSCGIAPQPATHESPRWEDASNGLEDSFFVCELPQFDRQALLTQTNTQITSSVSLTGARTVSYVAETECPTTVHMYSTRATTTTNKVDFDVVLWPIWHEEGRLGKSLKAVPAHSRDPSMATERIGDIVEGEGCWSSLILRPSSLVALIWDMLSVCVLAYDMMFIPMLAFQVSSSELQDCINAITTVFWTIDIVFSFCLGFDAGGVVEMRPGKIAKRYFMGWFSFDVLVAGVDWFMLVHDGGTLSPFGALRILKSLKLMRGLRVVRFLKVVQHLSWFTSLFGDEARGIAKFILVILLVTHYIACGWYLIGEHTPDQTTSWVARIKLQNGADVLTTQYMYLTCLHWSLTQFTPASMEVNPTTSLERFYAIVVILIGLLVFSSFVSGITAAMTTLRRSTEDRKRQLAIVSRYISEKRISRHLGNRISNFLKEGGGAKEKRVVESDVVALQRLPEQILLELHAEVFSPALTAHPVFHHLELLDPEGITWVCHLAASEESVGEKRIVFCKDQEASAMIFVTHGILKYFFSALRTRHDVVRGEYLCEASLWLQWEHAGWLEAETVCEMVHLNAHRFHDAVLKTFAMASLQRYAQQFAKLFLSSDQGSSDKWGVSFDAQQETAQAAFDVQLQQRHSFLEKQKRNNRRTINNRHSVGNYLFGGGLPVQSTVSFFGRKYLAAT